MTLDNYIMESEINDATVGDIYVEQALAEMEVAYALASSYTKDAMFVEYLAEMEGIDIYQEGFFQEADGDDDGRFARFKNKLKDIGSGIGDKAKDFGGKVKEAPGKVWEFLKKVASAIATAASNMFHFVTEKSIKTCIKKLEASGKESNLSVPKHLKTAVDVVLKNTNNFLKDIDDMATRVSPGFTNAIEDPGLSNLKKITESKETVVMTTDELLVIFKKLDSADVTKQIKGAIKKAKEIVKQCEDQRKKDAKTLDKWKDRREFNKEVHGDNKNALKEIKERGAAIIKAYSQTIRDYRTLANKILKQENVYSKASKAYNKKTGKQRMEDQSRVPGENLSGIPAEKDWENATEPTDISYNTRKGIKPAEIYSN
jgi:hypothetical protein